MKANKKFLIDYMDGLSEKGLNYSVFLDKKSVNTHYMILLYGPKNRLIHFYLCSGISPLESWSVLISGEDCMLNDMDCVVVSIDTFYETFDNYVLEIKNQIDIVMSEFL